MSRASIILAAFLAANSIAVTDAAAELLSSRPISIVIPFTPGASSDTLQRLVARKVTEKTGQTIVVDSPPGGGGAVCPTTVKDARPRPHPQCQATGVVHAANPALYGTLS